MRGFTIHPSRVVDFRYVEPVEFDAPEYFYGGISEFELIRNELVSDQVVQRAVPAILEKSSTLFYKVKGFKDLLADKQESTLVQYFESLENLRSIYGAGIVDQQDEIEVHSQALTNLAESDMITLRRLAMVTGLPLSWLVGEAARGLNSTGEGERQVLKQTIESYQSEYLLDNINRLMRLHGRGQVEFKDGLLETDIDRATMRSRVIDDALKLWQMGEDYTAYLQEHDVVTQDDFGRFFKELDVDDEGEMPYALEVLAERSGSSAGQLSQRSDEEDLAVDPQASLNGAQVTAILEIIARISRGEITKSTAQKIIATSFPVSMDEAGSLIGDVEEGAISGDGGGNGQA